MKSSKLCCLCSPHAGAVPGLAVLGAAADVGHGVDAAGVAHRDDRGAVGRAHADREAAVAGEHARGVGRRSGPGARGSGTAGSRCRRWTGTGPARRRSGWRRRRRDAAASGVAGRGASSASSGSPSSRLQSAVAVGAPAEHRRWAGEDGEREERLVAVEAAVEPGQRARARAAATGSRCGAVEVVAVERGHGVAASAARAATRRWRTKASITRSDSATIVRHCVVPRGGERRGRRCGPGRRRAW